MPAPTVETPDASTREPRLSVRARGWPGPCTDRTAGAPPALDPPTMLHDFKAGDWVIHADKPEWGAGQVLSAEGHVQDGKRCQRLSVRFDRAGLKTLTTLFASLRPSAPGGTSAFTEPKPDDDLSHKLDLKTLADTLTGLPENATDPFTSLPKRVEATLGLFRYTGMGASLLDWATAQTGLRDPLSAFNRHELEQHFQRFRTNVFNHLRRVTADLRKQDPATLAKLEAAAPPGAKQALQKAHALR